MVLLWLFDKYWKLLWFWPTQIEELYRFWTEPIENPQDRLNNKE